MDGQIIYVIIGTQGEYSDRIEWPVAWVDTEAAARDAVVKYKENLAKVEAETVNLGYDLWDMDWDDEIKSKVAETVPMLDPEARYGSCYRTSYYYWKVPKL